MPLILLDAAGVLFPADFVVAEYLTERFGVTTEQLRPMWQGIYMDYTVGALSTGQFLTAFAKMYGLQVSDVSSQDFTKPFTDWLQPMPGMTELLEALAAGGHKLALLSDTVEIFDQARRQLDMDRFFNRKFLSFEIGCKKPDPQAYHAVLRYYDIGPAEVFFVDDQLLNVSAARQLGMDAVQFESVEQLRRELAKRSILL